MLVTKVKVGDRQKKMVGGQVRPEYRQPPHKYIKNSSRNGTTPLKPPLGVRRRPQISSRADYAPWNEVGEMMEI